MVPELPEVETVRRCLEPVLLGATLDRVEVRHPRLARRNRSVREVEERLRGGRIAGLRRRGKFLFADLDGGLTWVTHLGMSGRMRTAGPADPEDPHTHVVVGTDRNDEVRMVDPRTFGFVAAFTPDELSASPLSRLGPDAWTDLPRTPVLRAALAGRTVAIKARLLDQTFVAGLGNIYADEVLHRAGVRPTRPAGSLDPDEVAHLRAAIRPVLRAGIRWGGTSLSDLAYLLPNGTAGQYLHRLAVYDREDQPCRRCGSLILRTVITGRSSFFCPSCQR